MKDSYIVTIYLAIPEFNNPLIIRNVSEEQISIFNNMLFRFDVLFIDIFKVFQLPKEQNFSIPNLVNKKYIYSVNVFENTGEVDK